MSKQFYLLKRQYRGIWMIFLLLSASAAMAAGQVDTVYRQSVDKPVAEVYDKLYKSLEDARFYVVFEPDIGKSLSRFSEKWGDDYNRNGLSAIRSMVFCNGWYANQVSNLDTGMLGLCPLHLTLIEKDGRTTVLFNRPSVIAAGSPALEVIREIESQVIEAIAQGLK